MTIITIDEFRANLDQYLASTAEGDVVLTRDGEPVVVLHGIQDEGNLQSSAFADSPEFWRMIHLRRQEQAISWDQARKELASLDE